MRKDINIVIVGSLNIDLVTTSKRFPNEGETIIGGNFEEFSGGKGANQAVAAARLGGQVSIIGCVGDDLYGHQIKSNLKKEGVDTSTIFTSRDINTGIAQISIANKQNKITVISGANYHLNTQMIQDSKETIKQADIVLLQLEIPMSSIYETIKITTAENIPVILNPAPAKYLPKSILSGVSYLTPNDVELSLLTKADLNTQMDYKCAINSINKSGINNVIVTRGQEGVLFNVDNRIYHLKSNPVNVVDTTGAGDTFNGALAVSLAEGKDIYEATDFANIAAALSTTKEGAQTGMPTKNDIKSYKDLKALQSEVEL